MPTPYSEGAGFYLGQLAAHGSNALGPQSQNIKNPTPVVLTGTPQSVALVAATLGQGQRVGLTGQIVGTNTSPGVDAELHMRILQDGTPITPEVIQPMPSTGDAVTANWSVTGLVIATAGVHSYALQAWATGDGGITIGANNALLNFGSSN